MDPAEFRKLQAVWYAKLKKSGFDEIEYSNGDMLRRGSFIEVSHRAGGPWEPKADYYRYAYHFLNEHKFKTKLDEVIWAYHAEGISGRDIAITLNKVKKKKINRMTVWRVIVRLREEMKKLYGIYGIK